MAFRVEVAPRAFEDLDAIAGYIKLQAGFAQAQKWFDAMIEAIASLRDLPTRCPVARESRLLGQEVRFLLHGRRNRGYRVYFSIRQEAPSRGIVRVFHVRHWARKPLSAKEWDEIMKSSEPN